MGCGWKPPYPVDMRLFTGVEVINGGGMMLSSADFWDRAIAGQVRLTAVGGSDNHNASLEPNHVGSIGAPTTVVEAAELSVPAILDGIRKGRVFIDLTGSRDRQVDMEAYDSALPGQERVRMGGVLQAPAGHSVSFIVQIAACPLATVVLFLDGHETSVLPPLKTSLGNENLPFSWMSDGKAHWLRAEVRDSNGSLMLVSNPVYINFPPTGKPQ